MVYNTSEQSTSGFTPFFLMFGKEARTPIDIMFGRPPENEGLTHSEYAIQLRDKLESSYDTVRQHRQRALQRQKDHYDKKVKVGVVIYRIIYHIYTMVQQTNLLPKNASRNGAIFAQKGYQIYATTSQYLSSYGCTIIMVYIIIYNFTLPCINANVYQSSITERLHTLCHTNNTVILYDIHTYPNNLYKYWLHNLA